MRIPRWLTAALLIGSVLVCLAALVPWIVGPTRTARQFVAWVEASDFENANRLMGNGEWHIARTSIQLRLKDSITGIPTGVGWGVEDPMKARIKLSIEPIGLKDILSGRRRLCLSSVAGYRSDKGNEVLWFDAADGMVLAEVRRDHRGP